MKIIIVLIRSLFLFSIVAFLIQCNSSSAGKIITNASNDEYQCIPCGYDCDDKIYTERGTCAHCQMELVKMNTINFKNIQTSEICKYINDHPGIILLDVRTKEEFEGNAKQDFGTLKNAINIPIQELKSKLTTLNPYKDQEIIVYCSHSHRSPQASYLLSQNGFKNITNLSGGMSELKDTSCKK